MSSQPEATATATTQPTLDAIDGHRKRPRDAAATERADKRMRLSRSIAELRAFAAKTLAEMDAIVDSSSSDDDEDDDEEPSVVPSTPTLTQADPDTSIEPSEYV